MAAKPPSDSPSADRPEPGSPEDLGLDKDVEKQGDAARNIEEKGEPFDDNFA